MRKDGQIWRVGTDAEVAWIAHGTSVGLTITAAIPPVFEAYATVVLPEGPGWSGGPGRPGGESQDRHDRAVLALLIEHSAGQPWWLGYLDTGTVDIVFADAPTVTLYPGWHYLLVEAGPKQAASWRRPGGRSAGKGALPDLMFPADRSWLLSTLWDDDWTCIGGPAGLVTGFLGHPYLAARPVALGQDATPPGHQAI